MRQLILSMCVGVIVSTQCYAGPTLFSIERDADVLVTIDTDTGIATTVGPLGFNASGPQLAIAGGQLYAVDGVDFYRIDAFTGAATFINKIGPADGSIMSGTSFTAVDGQLKIGRTLRPGRTHIIADLELDGSLTNVVDYNVALGLADVGFDSMASDSLGRLWYSDSRDPNTTFSIVEHTPLPPSINLQFTLFNTGSLQSNVIVGDDLFALDHETDLVRVSLSGEQITATHTVLPDGVYFGLADVSAIPAPKAVWLGAVGFLIAGFVAWRRRRREKMHGTSMEAFVCILLLSLFVGSNRANAAPITVFEEDFESYAENSLLPGQGGWITETPAPFDLNVIVATGMFLPTKTAAGFINPNSLGIQVAFHSINFNEMSVFELQYDAYASSGPGAALTSHNAEVRFRTFPSVPGVATGWSMLTPASPGVFGWQWATPGATEFIQGHFDKKVRLSAILDPIVGESYGRADFDGDGIFEFETARTPLSLTDFNRFDGVRIAQDWRTPQGRSGGEFDNILVTATPIPAPKGVWMGSLGFLCAAIVMGYRKRRELVINQS